jgi:hypothetical protein
MVTIRQPMAAAIFIAGKDVENKNWRIRNPHDREFWFGRIWICASQRTNRSDFDRWARQRNLWLPDEPLVRGAIIGCVELFDVVEDSTTIWAAPKKYRYQWKLRRPELLIHPVPCRGALYPQWIRPPRGTRSRARRRRHAVDALDWQGAK